MSHAFTIDVEQIVRLLLESVCLAELGGVLIHHALLIGDRTATITLTASDLRIVEIILLSTYCTRLLSFTKGGFSRVEVLLRLAVQLLLVEALRVSGISRVDIVLLTAHH